MAIGNVLFAYWDSVGKVFIIVYYATGGSTNGYIQTYIKILKHTRLKWDGMHCYIVQL